MRLPPCFRMRVVCLRGRGENGSLVSGEDEWEVGRRIVTVVGSAATANHDYHLQQRLRSPALRVAKEAIPIQGRDNRGQQSTRGRSPPWPRPEAGPSVEFIHYSVFQFLQPASERRCIQQLRTLYHQGCNGSEIRSQPYSVVDSLGLQASTHPLRCRQTFATCTM